MGSAGTPSTVTGIPQGVRQDNTGEELERDLGLSFNLK